MLARNRMKKVLILTAGFGEGHNAAARNLRDALELVSSDVQVEVLDLFESTYGRFNALVKRAHLGVVRHTPTLWRGIYAMLDHVPFADSGIGGLTRLRNALGDVLRVTTTGPRAPVGRRRISVIVVLVTDSASTKHGP